MSTFFISYRRQDSGGHAGRLLDRLAARFGNDHVFMDVQDIQPGQNFATAIEQTLARCSHVIAVVGPQWLELLKQRAAAGEDLVREEIAVALKRQLTVIPVLVGGAQMPSTSDLPPELAGFARCQAVEIRDNRFDDDCGDLLAALGADRPGAAGLPRRAMIGGVVAATAALVAGAMYFSRSPAAEAPPSLTGEWIGQFEKPGQKPYRLRLRLAQTGQLLAGSVEYPTGDGPIVESRIEDDGTFTFATVHTPDFATEPATIRFQGQVVDGRLQLVATDRDGIATGVATRSASAP